MKEKISIIIPAYNAEKYIEECIESIINQKYKNFEAIIINDGSKDKTLEICKKYSEKDDRIIVYSIENSGAAQARNYGLDRVTGKYITFLDADDVLDINYLETLYNNLIENNCDISICNYEEFKNNIKIHKEEIKPNVYDRNECIVKLNTKNLFTYALWGKLFKTELLGKERLPNIKTCEDNFILYKLLLKSNKIAYTKQILYHYRIISTSLTHQKGLISEDLMLEGERIIKLMEKENNTLNITTKYRYIINLLQLYGKMLYNCKYSKSMENKIKRKIDIYYKECKKVFSTKRRIQVILFRRLTLIYCILYKFYILLRELKKKENL